MKTSLTKLLEERRRSAKEYDRVFGERYRAERTLEERINTALRDEVLSNRMLVGVVWHVNSYPVGLKDGLKGPASLWARRPTKRGGLQPRQRGLRRHRARSPLHRRRWCGCRGVAGLSAGAADVVRCVSRVQGVEKLPACSTEHQAMEAALAAANRKP